MKRALCILMAAVMLIAATACGTDEKNVVIKPIDYKELQQKYLFDLTILVDSWDNAEELKSEAFPVHYAVYFILGGGAFVPDENRAIYIPQEDVEAMVQSHFDVSTDFLRSGNTYKPEREAYVFYGIASAIYMQITGAEKKGKTYTVNYNITGTTDKAVAQGTVVIEVDGKDYKYISNEITWE